MGPKVGLWQWALGVLMPLLGALLFMFFSSTATVGEKNFRIDTHAHMAPQFYKNLLDSKGILSGGKLTPEWTPEAHVSAMDSMNIGLSILSVSSPGAKLSPSDSLEYGRKLARELNDYAHMVTVEYPGRFQFFATLTLPDVEGSVAEAIYALDNLGAAGVIVFANSQGEYLGTKRFDPLLEALDARNATVFIHPTDLDALPVTNDVGGGKKVELPPFLIDFLLDTTRAAANLVYMNVPKRYPNINFLLAHSGGFLPFAGYRMAGYMSHATRTTVDGVLDELKKFYVDLAISGTPSAMPSTLNFIPYQQITYGSDYPYAPLFGVKKNLESIERHPLNETVKEHLFFHSANRLVEKRLQHWRAIWNADIKTGCEGGPLEK